MSNQFLSRVNSFAKKYKEFIYIIGVLAAFWDQRVTIQQTVHDEITQRIADKQLTDQQIDFIKYRLDRLENKTTGEKQPPPTAPTFEAVLPEGPSIVKNKPV